jgi:hypothetical protein
MMRNIVIKFFVILIMVWVAVSLKGVTFKSFTPPPPPPPQIPVRGRVGDIGYCEDHIRWVRASWAWSHEKPQLFLNCLATLDAIVRTLPQSRRKLALLAEIKMVIDEITTFMRRQ